MSNLKRKNNKAILTDTSGEAADVYYGVLRKLGPVRRAQMSFQLSDNLRRIVIDGIRYRHPEYNQKMVTRELFRLMFGDALFKEVWSRIK